MPFFKKSTIFSEYDSSTRLATLLNHGGTKILREIFHNKTLYSGKSLHPDNLYQEMSTYKKKLKKELHKDQMELVFPKSKKTESAKFDISLLVILIAVCCVVPPPSSTNDWLKTPNDTDTSIGANIVRLRLLRNEIIHTPAAELSKNFLDRWKAIVDVLTNLGFDIKTVLHLKTAKFLDLELYRLSILHARADLLDGRVDDIVTKVQSNTDHGSSLQASYDQLSDQLQLINDNISDLSSAIMDLDNAQKTQDNEIIRVQHSLQQILLKTRNYDSLFEQANHVLNILVKNINSEFDDVRRNQEHRMVRQAIQMKPLEERLEEASNSLKQKTRSRHERQCLRNPFSPTNAKKALFVDLVIANSDEINSECIGHLHHVNIHAVQSAPISVENVFNNHKFALLRGSAGVGKSYFIQNAVYRWSKDEVWENFKFVFHFQCREMNSYSDVENFESLLRKCYPEILEIISFSELLKISNKILVCLDGMDEFIGVSKFSELSMGRICETLPITRCVYHMLCFTDNTLANSHILLSGRPDACNSVRCFLEHVGMNTVDILGFDDENTARYIDIYFGSHKTRGDEVKRVVANNVNVKLMTRIPVYLWVICSLYDQTNINIRTPNTITELYIFELLLFMKKHYHGDLNMTEITWAEIIENNEIIKAILDLATISYRMISQNVRVFGKEDISAFIKSSGMLTEVQTIYGKKYQFFHLSMQEFLASIYVVYHGMCLNDVYFKQNAKSTRTFSDKSFRGLLPISFGLQHAEEISDDDSIPGKFMKYLRKDCREDRSQTLCMNRFLKRVRQRAAQECWLNNSDEYELFLNCYFECQQKLKRDEWLENLHKQGGLTLTLQVKLARQLKHGLYFLQNESKYVGKLKLTMLSIDHASSREMKNELARYLLDVPHVETDDESLSNFVPPLLGEEETYKLSLIDLFLTRKPSTVNARWLTLPKELTIRSGYSVELLLDTVKKWNIKAIQLRLVTIDLFVAHDDTIHHLLELLTLFNYVPRIHITMSQLSEATELRGFQDCPMFSLKLINYFKFPSKLKELNLKFKVQQHKYRIADDGVVCCSERGERLSPFPIGYEDFSPRSTSVNSSINDLLDITERGDQSAFFPNAVSRNGRTRCLVVFFFVALLCGLVGVLVWLFAFDGRYTITP